MEEPITKTQAYQLFGKLYNKQRPPELQKKVEEIVSRYSDIFVRIQKIKELDSQYYNTKKNEVPKTIEKPANKNSIPIKRAEQKNFISILLKGGEIPQWGEKTGTLIHGLFGLNLKLSNNVYKTFDLFEEKQIIDTIKSFAFFIQKGWDDFPPEKYNIIVTAYQFFKEYINVKSILKKFEELSSIIQQTYKMQVLYANLLLFPDFKTMLEEEYLEWLKKEKDIVNLLPNTASVIRMIANLENRRPKFTDVILSFYVLQRRKIISWEELLRELNVKKPVMNRYRAPESILKIINQKIEKLKSEIDKREESIKDINYIRNKFFFINEQGKINIEFLNNIVIQILKRQWGESRLSKDLIKNTISEPHKLLNVLFQDFDLNFINFFSSTVIIQDQRGQHLDVSIIKPILFKKELEIYSETQQELQDFLKQYKNAEFQFNHFYQNLKSKSADVIIQNFIRIINKAINFFRKMITSVRIILYNHEEALELERKGALKEAIHRTKLLPIEDLNPQPRFIPYAEFKIISSGRLNDMTIKNALEELVKDFYNYLYLYRDPITLERLSAIPRLQSEIEIYKKKLLQYGIEIKK